MIEVAGRKLKDQGAVRHWARRGDRRGCVWLEAESVLVRKGREGRSEARWLLDAFEMRRSEGTRLVDMADRRVGLVEEGIEELLGSNVIEVQG